MNYVCSYMLRCFSYIDVERGTGRLAECLYMRAADILTGESTYTLLPAHKANNVPRFRGPLSP